MDYFPGLADNEVRAQLQLLRALMQNKSHLKYELSTLNFTDSHKKSNPMVRDLREAAFFSKLLKKKLSELISSQEHLCLKDSNASNPETVNTLISLISSSEENISQVQEQLHEFEDSQKILGLVKERYQQLKEELDRKKLNHEINNKCLAVLPKTEELKELVNEIKEYKEELEFYLKENSKIVERKAALGQGRRRSVEKVKLYKEIPESALKLRSKILVRADLEKNIKKAETELEFRFQRVEIEKSRLEALQKESPSAASLQLQKLELVCLANEISDLENELETLYSEREELISPVPLNINFNGHQEDNITVSLVSILAGLSEMRVEKESLIEQSNKLKQRITSLFKLAV